jgi:hypothetical protein
VVNNNPKFSLEIISSFVNVFSIINKKEGTWKTIRLLQNPIKMQTKIAFKV